ADEVLDIGREVIGELAATGLPGWWAPDRIVSGAGIDARSGNLLRGFEAWIAEAPEEARCRRFRDAGLRRNIGCRLEHKRVGILEQEVGKAAFPARQIIVGVENSLREAGAFQERPSFS